MKLFLNGKLMMLFFGAVVLQSEKENYSLFSGCNSTAKKPEKTTSLKQAYKNDFLIGTALNTPQIEEKDSLAAALITAQFNAATPENIMKAEIKDLNYEVGIANVENKYPLDIQYNVCIMGDKAIHNFKFTDKKAIQMLNKSIVFSFLQLLFFQGGTLKTLPCCCCAVIYS